MSARPNCTPQNSHGHAKTILQNLLTIWARAFKNVRQPYYSVKFWCKAVGLVRVNIHKLPLPKHKNIKTVKDVRLPETLPTILRSVGSLF